MGSHCVFHSAQSLGSTAFLVRLKPAPGFAFLAGQYLKLIAPSDSPDGLPMTGYFSIASPPESELLELVVRESRRGTAADVLIGMSAGQALAVEGPFGSCTFKPAAHRHICFISQGTGVAPLLSILRSRSYGEAAPLSTTFLAGFRDELEMIGLEPFGSPLQPARYLVTLSQPRQEGWPGLKGRVTDHLRQGTLAIDFRNTEFYLCGSPEMTSEVRSVLSSKGVASSSVYSD